MDSESQIATHSTEIDQVNCEASQMLNRPILFDSIAWFTINNTNLNINYSRVSSVYLATYSLLFPRTEIKSNQLFQCCTLLDNFQVNCQFFLATTINGSGITNDTIKEFLYSTKPTYTFIPEIKETSLNLIWEINSTLNYQISSTNSTSSVLSSASVSIFLLKHERDIFLSLILFYVFSN